MKTMSWWETKTKRGTERQRRDGETENNQKTKRRIGETEKRQDRKSNKMTERKSVRSERRKNRYLEDINIFRDSLLKSDIGARIAKIIWFGSTLKKRAQEDSDVDIIINLS